MVAKTVRDRSRSREEKAVVLLKNESGDNSTQAEIEKEAAPPAEGYKTRLRERKPIIEQVFADDYDNSYEPSDDSEGKPKYKRAKGGKWRKVKGRKNSGL